MHFRRGVQLLQAGQVSAAMAALFQAMQLDPGHFEAHHALGTALMRSGRFADAGVILTQALKLRSDSAGAWRDLGTCHDRQNLYEQALEAYRRSVELAPNSPELLQRLGELYTMFSRTEEAGECYERAADLEGDKTKAQLYRSDARLLRGDVFGAEQCARQAVERDPGSGPAHGTLAGLLYARGRFEEAAESFEAALRIDPRAGRCWYGLADCRTYSEADNPVLERMEATLQREDLGDLDRMTIHFAAGKISDDRADYTRAMEHFEAANRLRARDLKFDRASLAALVNQTIQRFTPDFIASGTRYGTQNPKPLFIVGMYRSGTTLLEQIISSHPEVAAGGELTVWTPMDLEPDPATGEFHPDRARAAVAKYLAVLNRIGPSAARVTDKLPVNFFRLGAIHALLPKARIIHCRRDPVDTCLSIYSNLFKSRVSFAARKDDLVFFYRQYLRLMEHWRKVLPSEAFLDVQYERLVADHEAETRRMIAFAGLEWDDRCLRPELSERAIDTASARQARQPVYTTGLQRWRHYEPWLGELRQLLSDEAGGGR